MKNYNRFYNKRILTAARVLSLAAIMAFTSPGCRSVNDDILPEPDENGAFFIIPPGDEITGSETGDAYGSDSDYVYESLSDVQKNAYDSIVNAVLHYEPQVKLPGLFSPSDIKKLFTLVYTQESNIFWLSSILSIPAGPSDTINLNYRYPGDDLDIMGGELEIAAGNILESLPGGCTAYEAVKRFHDSIVTGCGFSSEKEHVNSAYGALVDGYAQCEGYAFAMSFLCDRAGIPNFVVTGTDSEGATHAWNKINISGSWYNVDCTWDDPILKYENKLFIKHDYLLVPDKDIIGITHFPNNDYFSSPVCDSEKNNYYAMEGILFKTAQEGIDYLRDNIRLQAMAGRREVEFRLASREEYDRTAAELFDNNKIRSIIEDINGNTGAGIKSAYKYNNERLYIIHISLIFDRD